MSNGLLSCPRCVKVFATKQAIRTHASQAHDLSLPDCDECGALHTNTRYCSEECRLADLREVDWGDPDVEQELRARHEAGENWTDIAEDFPVTPTRLGHAAAQHYDWYETVDRPGIDPDVSKAEVIELYEELGSIRKVAERIEPSFSWVRRRLIEWELHDPTEDPQRASLRNRIERGEVEVDESLVNDRYKRYKKRGRARAGGEER